MPAKSNVLRVKKVKKFNASNIAVFVLLIITIAAILAFIWSFLKYQEAKDRIAYLGSPQGRLEENKKEIKNLLSRVGRHIILPVDVEPTVATVMDAESLSKSQPFFKMAINGDKVIVYADKAILYSPDRDVIVNVAPVQVGSVNNKKEKPTDSLLDLKQNDETKVKEDADTKVNEIENDSMDIADETGDIQQEMENVFKEDQS